MCDHSVPSVECDKSISLLSQGWLIVPQAGDSLAFYPFLYCACFVCLVRTVLSVKMAAYICLCVFEQNILWYTLWLWTRHSKLSNKRCTKIMCGRYFTPILKLGKLCLTQASLLLTGKFRVQSMCSDDRILNIAEQCDFSCLQVIPIWGLVSNRFDK